MEGVKIFTSAAASVSNRLVRTWPFRGKGTNHVDEAMLELITQEVFLPAAGHIQGLVRPKLAALCTSPELRDVILSCQALCALQAVLFHLRYMSYPSAVFRSSCGGCTWALWRETLLRLMQPHSQQRTLRGVCRPGLLWLRQPGQHVPCCC